MMTVKDVQDRVDKIIEISGDAERAHSMEDDLHHDVLTAIAEGHPTPVSLAIAALQTLELSFERWCA